MRSGTETASGRATRSSTVASVPSTRSRRALGDVSNNRSSIASQGAVTKQAAPPAQGLRRSRRLSKEPPEAFSTSEATSTDAVQVRSVSVARGAAGRRVSRPSQDRGSVALKTSRETSRPKRTRAAAKSGDAQRKKQRNGDSDDEADWSSGNYTDETQETTPSSKPFSDILETTDYGLCREPFDASMYTPGVAEYDWANRGDAQEVPGYVTDIFQRLYNAESLRRPEPYMEFQEALNGMMRSILVDWIVEVHMKFRLLPETLYLCVNIIDRYLSRVQVPRKELQLVGVTALLVACKYEEIYPPEVRDCVYITDRAYTRQEVLDTEASIVKALEFELTVPTAHPFLRRFLHVTRSTTSMKHLAGYYLERMLQEHSSLEYRPSILAAAAVSLARNNPDLMELEGIGDDGQGVPLVLLDYTGFRDEDVKEAAAYIALKMDETEVPRGRRPLVAVNRKYESTRYGQASTAFRPPHMSHLETRT